LFDQTKCHSKAVRNTLINNQLETLLKSQLYGVVVLVNFRNYAKEVHFENEEIAQKYSPEIMAKNSIKVEMTQPGGGEEKKIGDKIIKMPPKKEMISVCHVENLVLLNVCPTLIQSAPKALPNCYQFLRSSQKPAQTLFTLINATLAKLKLKSQVGLVIDRLEMLTSLCGPDQALSFVK
jgi:hypothetical protein